MPVEAGSSARSAARRLQVSASTAVKWVQRKRRTGSVEAKPMHGHPPAKLLPHKDRLLRVGGRRTGSDAQADWRNAWRQTASMSARAAFTPFCGATASA